MRRSDGLVGIVALLAGAMSAGAMACVFNFDVSKCEDYPAPGCPGVTSTTTGSPDSGAGGMDSGPPPSCIPSLDPTMTVPADCGVFVSATGSDTGAGDQNDPLQMLNAAITKAKTGKKRIYVCAETFTEKISIPAGFTVFGGLDCSAMPRSWKYVGDKTQTTITAMSSSDVPMTLESGTGTSIADLHVLAPPGTNPGDSSIAMIANKVTATIDHCKIEAQDAADGAAGQNYPDAAQGGTTGQTGGDACSASAVNGGNPVTNICGGTQGDSVSGNGGQGFASNGSPGGQSSLVPR